MTMALAGRRVAARAAPGSQTAPARLGNQHDPAELEADRFAERMTGLRAPRGCASCGNRAVGRHLAQGLSSPGQPLPPGLRDRFEPQLGADLSGARLHVDSDAAASARGLGARAYTLGADVVFAGGTYSPGTAEGLRLIAHELAHVAQAAGDPSPVLRREGDPAAPPPPPAGQEYDPCKVEVGPLTNEALIQQLAIVRNYLNPRERGQDKYYDYANLARRLGEERRKRIDMGHIWLGEDGLTTVPDDLYRLDSGAGFMMTVLPADVAAERGAPTLMASSSVVTRRQFEHLLDVKQIPAMDVVDYFRQQDPRAPEPLRLVLPPPPSKQAQLLDFSLVNPLQPVPTLGTPAEQLLPSPFGLPRVVSPLEPGALHEPEARPPGPVAFVFTDQGLTMVPLPEGSEGSEEFGGGVGATTMVAGGRVYQSPIDITALPYIAEPVITAGVNPANPRSVAGARTRWRGGVFEQSQTGFQALSRTDLNQIQRNFPEWDFRQMLTGANVQRGQSASADWGFYQEKLLRLGGSRPATFGGAVGLVNQAFGSNMTIVEARGQSWLEVPVDQVAGVRAQFQQNMAASPGDWANLIDANLRARPVKVGDQTFGSFNDLEAARVANNPVAAQVRAELGQRLVRPGAITMPELLGQMAFREQGVGPGGQPLTAGEYRAQVGPEFQESIRLGGRTGPVGAVPEPALGGMAWRSGARGAGAGAAFGPGWRRCGCWGRRAPT